MTAPQHPEIRVEDHLGLVHGYVRSRWAASASQRGGIDQDDLLQAGMLGLLRGAETYDPSRGAPSTYLMWWVRHYVAREFADRAEPVRVPVHRQEQRRKAGELARAQVYSLDCSLKCADDDQQRYIDRITYARGEGLAAEPEAQAELERLIERTPSLSDRERQIMSMRARGATLEDAGAELGCSRERARQIEAGAVLKIRERLVADGELETVEVPRFIAAERAKAESRRREREGQRRAKTGRAA
ncbi:MAG TPA: sigma-70 family RNA polymerase sigma factor [Polyangiaceae bacterium]|nr:sigma-70 family RNA polymerase sigma factor [Polyangiaceae bacterium]